MPNRLCKILIADDERPVAASLQNLLETLGYDVVAVVPRIYWLPTASSAEPLSPEKSASKPLCASEGNAL